MDISFKQTNKQTKQPKNTIAVLDGVRAIACLTVLVFHLNLTAHDNNILNFSSVGAIISAIAVTGSSGVTLFFILSGFLLFLPYAKALLFETAWPATRQFYLRRALRIIPGYYVALFVLIFLQGKLYLQPAHLGELGLFLTLFMDSLPLTYQKINGPFWTLAVEWQFYLLLPFLALGFRWLVHHFAPHKRWQVLTACLLGLIVWGIATRGLGLYAANHPNETFFLPRPVFQTILFFVYGTSGKYLEDFAVGMLISMCYVFSQQAAADHSLSKYLLKISRWLWGIGILWLVVVSLWHYDNWFHKDASLFFFDPVSPVYYLLGEISLSLGFGLCITALLFGPAYLRWPLELRPLRWIGMISYSLYIWHLPILADFMLHLKPLQQQGVRNAILYALLWFCAICLIIPFSYMVYKWIEEPWIHLSGKLSQRGKQAQPAAKTW